MSLPIDEIFPALQGEGERMGVPCVFVRTGGCNLRCEGFGCTTISPKTGETLTGCDSIHAVQTKHFKHLWNYYEDFIYLVKDIQKAMITKDIHDNAEPVDIVFTGGEPLLHHQDPVLRQSIEYFVSRKHKVYFETNGTVFIDFEKYPEYKNVNFCISVKMSTSGEEKSKRWQPEVVNEYLKNTKYSFFKFVLSKDSIEKETNEIFEFLEQVPTFGVVYLMPKGENTKEIQQNAKAVYEFAQKNGFRYSDRLHIRIYEDQRGV